MKTAKRIFSIALLLAGLALPFVIWKESLAIEDWWKLRNYTPPTSVVSLADQDTLTSYGRHIFYVNHPQLVDSVTQFRQDCTLAEQTIVLGCYHSDQQGIDVFNVKDARLAGVQEVTAAHEMLHAAYDRLDSKEKTRLDGWLNDYYKTVTDSRLISTINSYKKTEPNDVVNEMHSIFGTEVASLPAPLENYYKQYFKDRQAVVNFAQSYQNEFTRRVNEINQDKLRLDQLKALIDAEEQSLNAQLAKINSDRARLDSMRNSGQTEAYNAAVPGFNAEVDAYNQGIKNLQDDITSYNQLVASYNSVAEELRNLEQAIDTRLAPQPAQ